VQQNRKEETKLWITLWVKRATALFPPLYTYWGCDTCTHLYW